MNITTDLKLTFPVRWNEAGKATIYAYHTPIGRDVFEANWRIISATAAKLLRPGVAPEIISIATLALKDAGRADAIENRLADGVDFAAGGTAAPFLAELRRLTTILAPTPSGYQRMPVEVAIGNKLIDADDWSEAEDALVFFTCGWWSANRQRREGAAATLALALGGSITSYSPTDFAASLQTSTPPETSAETAAPETTSAIPQ